MKCGIQLDLFSNALAFLPYFGLDNFHLVIDPYLMHINPIYPKKSFALPKMSLGGIIGSSAGGHRFCYTHTCLLFVLVF
jgi:hypothetical protein